MVYAKKNGQDLTLLFLDLKKVYDRISWNFMRSMLVKLGFHEDFIRGIMALYKNA